MTVCVWHGPCKVLSHVKETLAVGVSVDDFNKEWT